MTLAYRDFRILTYERCVQSLEFERFFILPEKTGQVVSRIQDEVVENAILSESSGWKKSVKILTLAKSLKYELYL